MTIASAQLEERKLVFEEAAGARIDALESALNAFEAGNDESHEALRQQARLVYEEAQFQRLPIIAAAAMSFSSVSVSGNALRLRGARM